jgi:hypothetical protein
MGNETAFDVWRLDLETLQGKLERIDDIRELEGFANRRRYFPMAPRWTEDQRQLILRRKYELEKKHGRYKKG